MSESECPDTTDGNHKISSHTHTDENGETKTVWSCDACGFEWSY